MPIKGPTPRRCQAGLLTWEAASLNPAAFASRAGLISGLFRLKSPNPVKLPRCRARH